MVRGRARYAWLPGGLAVLVTVAVATGGASRGGVGAGAGLPGVAPAVGLRLPPPPPAVPAAGGFVPVAFAGGQAAPAVDLPFQEGHWQGLETIPLTPTLAGALGIPAGARGVLVDDATPPADLCGFQAGDLVTAVGQVATPDLASFVAATARVRDRSRAEVQILRGGVPALLVLRAQGRLGTAQAETAPMIPPGSVAPHRYQGPCTGCHHIGTVGQLPVDAGDLITKTAPPIRVGQRPPHRDRGVCTACHRIGP